MLLINSNTKIKRFIKIVRIIYSLERKFLLNLKNALEIGQIYNQINKYNSKYKYDDNKFITKKQN